MTRSLGPDLALDLVNTMGPVEGSFGDRLRTPDELFAWLEARGLAEARLPALRASPPEAAILLSEARRLRSDLTRALGALEHGAPPPSDAVYGLDRILSASSVAKRLHLAEGRPLLVEVETGVALPTLLAPVALAAAGLLSDVDPRRVRRCAAPDCGAWFVDTSKGGRRKWCSMATCGNRAKAARHRTKQRARGAPTT